MGQSLGFISLDKTGLSCQEMQRGHLVRPLLHSEWAADGVGSHQLGFRIKLEVLDGLVVLYAVFQSQDLVLKLIMQTPMVLSPRETGIWELIWGHQGAPEVRGELWFWDHMDPLGFGSEPLWVGGGLVPWLVCPGSQRSCAQGCRP